MTQLPYGSLFGAWSVKIVNELDRCSREAQDLLLTYLDRMPAGRAFPGTSNLQLDLLTERFQTRFQAIKLLPPGTANAGRVPPPALAGAACHRHSDRSGQRRLREGRARRAGILARPADLNPYSEKNL